MAKDMDKAAIDIAKALVRLSALTIFELRGEWRRLHRMPPPMRLSRDLLIRGISYKLQERAYGGLSPATARKLERASEAEVNAGLVELIKDAFTIRIQLLSGSDDNIEAMSGRLGMNKCRLTSLIRLSYLAPDIVRALLEGRQPIELTPTRLLRLSKDLPHDWSEQRHVLGFAA